MLPQEFNFDPTMIVYLRTFAQKNFPVDRSFFFSFLRQSENELLGPEMQKKLSVTDFGLEIKRVENYPDLEKLVHAI